MTGRLSSGRSKVGEGAATRHLPPPPVISGHLAGAWLRLGRIAAPVLYLAAMVALGALAWLRPIHGWDTLPYLTLAMWDGSTTFDFVHREIYRIVQAGLSPAEFTALAEGDAYRLRQYVDPDAFRSMLGMYEVKWLYIRLLDVFAGHFEPLKAMIALNIAALALMTIAVGAWTSRHRLWLVLPLGPALVFATGAGELVRLTTPDMLCLAFGMSGLLMLDRERPIGALASLTAATLTRPDMAVLPVVLLAVFVAFGDPRWRMMAAAAVMSVAAYLFVTHGDNHVGYVAHFWFSTYQIQETMAGFDPAFSIKVYVTAFAWNLARAATENVWLGFWLGAAVMWVVATAKGLGRDGGRDLVVIAALGAVAAKFVLFPLHDARTYLPILLPALILLAAQWTPFIHRNARYGAATAK